MKSYMKIEEVDFFFFSVSYCGSDVMPWAKDELLSCFFKGCQGQMSKEFKEISTALEINFWGQPQLCN